MVVLWELESGPWTVALDDTDAGGLFLCDIQINNATMSQDHGLAQTAT